MKAATAISGEIVYSRLIEKLIYIIVENAGANRGLLLLSEDEINLFVEAELNSNTNTVRIEQHLKHSELNDLPQSVLNYVFNTRESLVLNNAAGDSRFSADPYVKKEQSRSLLCLPILRQSKIMGLIYLENSLVEGAFTPERIHIINTLGTQAAISLENAQLYSQLEKKVHQRTRELEIEKDKLKSKNEIMENEIALAKKIQDKLIPTTNPTEYISSLYKPMKEVGGDLYDFLEFSNSNKIGIFISDVSGHGVPAAFITSMIKTTILQSGERKENPAELLSYINEVLLDQTAGNFITVFYGIYDPDKRKILYSNAGHPQPYIITVEGITQLPKGRNTALAMFSNSLLEEKSKSYMNFEANLPVNSKLLFYTDGLTEACQIGGKIFFEDDVMMDVLMNSRNFSSQLFIDTLYSSLIRFRGEDSFEDDVCLVCLNVE